jgi:hypothetical protein
MALSHSLVLNWVRSGESITETVTVSADGEQNFDITVPGSSNIVFGCEIDVSVLAALYIHSTGTITLATNDDGTPDDTFTITAEKPLIWYTGCGLPNPFASTVDVESMKATKGTATDATLKIRILQDSTP